MTRRDPGWRGPPETGKGAALRGYSAVSQTGYLKAMQEFKKLPTDEARAVCAHAWVKMAAQDVNGCWMLLVNALAVIRNQEAYRFAPRVGGKTYADFPSYFEAVAKRPFAQLAELEGTKRVLLDAGFRLDELLRWSYDQARDKARNLQKVDELDRASQRGRGNPTGGNQYQSGNDNNVIISTRPEGNSAQQALRRLRQHRPALHARVLAGELSPHAAMIQAGFRQKTITVPLTADGFARAARKHLDAAQRAALITALQENTP